MSFVTNLFNLFKSLLCGTLSNAFEKSIIIISTCNLLLRDWARSCAVIIIIVPGSSTNVVYRADDRNDEHDDMMQ